jgi:cellulose 1,4-beta-cellobiosidase
MALFDLLVSGFDVKLMPIVVDRDTTAKVPSMGEYLADIKAQNDAGAQPPIAGIFVVYNLPDRDCAALASNGELAIADGGVEKYKAYIDSIREHVLAYADTNIILVIGWSPDSFSNGSYDHDCCERC